MTTADPCAEGCPSGDTVFDRGVCPQPCGAMHTRCRHCGATTEPCAVDAPNGLGTTADAPSGTAPARVDRVDIPNAIKALVLAHTLTFPPGSDRDVAELIEDLVGFVEGLLVEPRLVLRDITPDPEVTERLKQRFLEAVKQGGVTHILPPLPELVAFAPLPELDEEDDEGRAFWSVPGAEVMADDTGRDKYVTLTPDNAVVGVTLGASAARALAGALLAAAARIEEGDPR